MQLLKPELFKQSSSTQSHHVGVSSPGHALARVQVKEFVDLGGSQSVPNFQLLDNEDLPGQGMFTSRTNPKSRCSCPVTILPRYSYRVGLVLQRHLKMGEVEWHRHLICMTEVFKSVTLNKEELEMIKSELHINIMHSYIRL